MRLFWFKFIYGICGPLKFGKVRDLDLCKFFWLNARNTTLSICFIITILRSFITLHLTFSLIKLCIMKKKPHYINDSKGQ